MVFVPCWGKTLSGFFIKDLPVSVVFFWDGWVDVRFVSDGCLDIDPFPSLLGLVSCSFNGIVAWKGVCCPINVGIEHFEPGMSKDHSITSYVSDVETKGL
jgi:hypothetical protein